MHMSFRFLLPFALVAATLLSLIFTAAARSETLNCLECHNDIGKEQVVHSPFGAGECTSCHQPLKGRQHPEEKGSVALVEAGAKLCYMCHESLAGKKHVHAPVASGDCIACHSPHASANAKLLKNSGASLCLTCHEDKYRHKFGHGPVVAGNCLVCHDPHQSDNRKLLKIGGAELCFSCHDRSGMTGKSVHAPVAKGNCVACHAPHGSQYRKLLRNNFPDPFYMSYNADNFSLCFGCHNRDIAADRRTDTITNFRDGDRNLHYLHVNKSDKGRSCKTCHDPHAAGQPRLIKARIPGFGRWEIPINFEKTATGGTCTVGCHKPRTYDRARSDDE